MDKLLIGFILGFVCMFLMVSCAMVNFEEIYSDNDGVLWCEHNSNIYTLCRVSPDPTTCSMTNCITYCYPVVVEE